MSWLDRWEIRNYNRDVAAGGRGLAPSPDVARSIVLGHAMMDPSIDPDVWDEETIRRVLGDDAEGDE